MIQLNMSSLIATALTCIATVALVFTGCKRSADDVHIETKNPKVAASQLEQAFSSAAPELAEHAKAAAQAMQAGQYERAISSLEVVRGNENLTLEQGIAVHSSIVSMEAKLIQAIQAGDPNAKRAYELLKALKRN
ncbi:MAG: hypothetical protein N3G20_01470 [Verrucomicrobiae bacterium]|nr:hypothetical protein [Verrucomicrobiae bacterium]